MELSDILGEFGDVVQSRPGRTALAVHRIDTGAARPVRVPSHRIPHAYREAVEQELQEMVDARIIEPSRSEWASSIVLVKKRDGGLRLCVDYRRLNAVTPLDAYPMPRINDLIDKLGGAKYISTLDLSRGYWQVSVA